MTVRTDNVEHHEGVAARRAGKGRTTNPYSVHGERWERWNAGWDAADAEPNYDEDQRHAINVKDAAEKLNAAIRDALVIGLRVELVAHPALNNGHGISSTPPRVQAAVVRPIRCS